MADASFCQNCGGERPADAPEGLCPRCLMLNAPSLASPVSPNSGAQAAPDEDGSEATGAYISRPASAPVDVTGEWSEVPSGPTQAAAIPVTPASMARGVTVRYFGDYEILRELGRGGMGVVYEARQVSLNRAVALKLIKAGLLADDAELRRFQNEAEAVALLDHPGIVSAYEVGQHQGQQYLAMKLVRGESLSSLLRRYHDDPRAAAELVAEAAEAVAHAHSRGILHRDLKPANILIDAEGHPHITDFGLAKRLEADLEMTASGAILGTPAYMAPEQATGRRGGVSTATDVYGLGSVLYALLTGRAPFGGDTVVETLDALRSRPPEPPTRLNSRAPRDLETICLKCLEKDPRRRYASAQALADDLRAWLDSRPIAARRVGPAERALLWCRRHPAVAALTTIAVVAVVGGTAATIAVQVRANRALLAKNEELTIAYGREAKANAELASANKRVEQRYELAMDAIKTFHTGVSEDFLLKEPQFKAIRDRLLNSAGDFYEKLGRTLEGGTNAASRRALLRLNFELAELATKVGRPEDSLELHRRVLAGREALAESEKADPGLKVEVGQSLRAVISLLKRTGQRAEVPPLLKRAVEFHERLAADHPGDAEAQDSLASILNVLGDQLKNVDYKRDEAERQFRRALAIRRSLAEAHPNEPKFRVGEAEPLANLSYFRADEGKLDEAIRQYQEVIDIYREWMTRDPGDMYARRRFAGAQQTLSTWHNDANRPDAAVAPARVAVETYQKIVADQPAVSDHQASLAINRYTLGLALFYAKHPDEGVAELRESVKVRQRLADEFPTVTEHLDQLANSLNALGFVLSSLNRTAEAETAYRDALATQKKLVKARPGDADLLDSLGLSHMNLGNLLAKTGKPAEGEKILREGAEIQQKLSREHPAMLIYHARLWATRRFLYSFLSKTERLSEAEAELRLALVLSRTLAETPSAPPSYRNNFASDVTTLGDLFRSQGRIAEASEEYKRAIAIREQLVKDYPQETLFRSHLAWSLRRRGLARGDLGDLAGAAADARKAVAFWDALPRRTGEEWFETACAHAALVGMAGREGSGVSAATASPEVDAAIGLLSKAVGAGYRDALMFRTEHALDPLRNRPEFQLLMMDAAFPTDPFAR